MFGVFTSLKLKKKKKIIIIIIIIIDSTDEHTGVPDEVTLTIMC